MTRPVPGPRTDTTRPKLVPPPLACDCHMHVFGPLAKYPFDPRRNYTPAQSVLEDYLRMAATLGVERAVFVQASVYGTDNSAHRDAMLAMRGRGRGIAVIDDGVSDAEVVELERAGFRGARFNLVHTGGSTAIDELERIAARAAKVGWHVQLYLRGPVLLEIGERLKRLPTEFVIDHMGHMDPRLGVSQPAFQTLLSLLDSGRCWVKLSGPYRFDLDGPPYRNAIPFARELVKRNPERLVWATDWPHPDIPSAEAGRNGEMPDDAVLLDALLNWVPDEAVRNRILVENPGRLYRFD